MFGFFYFHLGSYSAFRSRFFSLHFDTAQGKEKRAPLKSGCGGSN
jgi:hypothetical protein